MSTKKLYKVLLVTVAPLAFAASVHADCIYDNFSSNWICDPYEPVEIGGSGGGGGGTGTGYPGGSWGTGGSSLPGYSGLTQVVQYVGANRQYCRPSTQSCGTWASLAGRSTSEGGYDLCAAFASPGSLGFVACQSDLWSIYYNSPDTKWACAEVGC
jgi:hypothetical protein